MIATDTKKVLPDKNMCMAMVWLTSSLVNLPRGLYWTPNVCDNIGGYICKKNQISKYTFICIYTIIPLTILKIYFHAIHRTFGVWPINSSDQSSIIIFFLCTSKTFYAGTAYSNFYRLLRKFGANIHFLNC